MKLVLILIFLFQSSAILANEFLLTIGHSYNQSNITGQNIIPTYKGSGNYAEAEYLMPVASGLAISLFGTYLKNNQLNTANESDFEEKLTIAYTGFGLKIYFQNLFLSGSIGTLQFADKISGENESEITANAMALEGGIGYRIKMSALTGIIIGFNVLKSTLEPDRSSGLDDPYDFWQYRANIAFNLILPSAPESSGPSNMGTI